MRRFVIGCIAVLVFVIARPVAAARPVQPPEAPLVEVVIRAAEGGAETTTTGVIWPGGGVLVRLKGIEDAAGATIRSADGVERLSPGVLTYQTEAGVALLAVDWGGEAPASAVIAEQAPRPGDELWLQFIEKGERAALRAEVQTVESLQVRVGLEGRQPAERIAGCPLVDASGAIAAMPSGFFVGAMFKPGSGALPAMSPRAGLTAVRCETLRAIKAGALIPWEDWARTTVPQIREASKRVDEAGAIVRRDEDSPDLLRLVREAVELDPQNAAAWRMLADGLYSGGRYEEAVEAAARATMLTVTDGPALTTASLALCRLGRTNAAVQAVESAIEIGYDLSGSYARLGFFLSALERHEEAVEAFKKSLALDPKSAWTKRAIAEALRHLGRDEEARQYE